MQNDNTKSIEQKIPRTKGNRNCRWMLREAKRNKAQKLLDSMALRSNAEQIKLLDKRLGKNVGAIKERSRLSVVSNKSQTPLGVVFAGG